MTPFTNLGLTELFLLCVYLKKCRQYLNKQGNETRENGELKLVEESSGREIKVMCYSSVRKERVDADEV